MSEYPIQMAEFDQAGPAASTVATGNAGATFEREVGATILATLLTGGVALFSSDAAMTAAQYQVGNLG